MLNIKHADLTLNDPQELSWLFTKAAELAPDNLAVVHNENSITYKELDLLSNRYAKYLRDVHTIQSGDMVCVVYDRGIDFIISILAILKCGATYVPIDAKEPSSRHKMIIEDVNPKLMIIEEKYTQNFEFSNYITIGKVEDIQNYSDARKNLNIAGHNIACVFFTSGSTGKPKGVLMPHTGIAGLIMSPHYLTIGANDNILSSSSIAFDAASFEIWTALLNSATLVCIDYEVIINPEEYANFLEKHNITVMWVTSALFDQLVAFRAGMFKKVKYLLSGGDVVNPKTVYKVLNNEEGRPDAFINGYGPTEAGILATFHIVRDLDDENSPLPVGKALADTVLYVLDAEQKPVGVGETGELYIGGHRLARGYLNLPEKNAEHFIRNPFTSNPIDMLYRTGDLVHFNSEGSLQFSGRADRQIKFRGFRLELDGVENVLVSHQYVANAAIKMIKYKSEKILVAYIQLEKNQEDNFFLSEYILYLKSKMPVYSVPSEIVVLDKLPVTQRGKIDRKQLPDPVFKEKACLNIVKPQTQTQKIIYDVWSECLGRTEFGIKDNFFELGGSSILLATVYAGIRSKINKPFSLNTFFEMPTIEGLATSIDEHGGQFDHDVEFSDAKRDAILDESMLPNWSDTSKISKNIILLTGSMGYLGGHVLFELLEKTDSDVYCLLRSHEDVSLYKQQVHSLKKLKLEDALKFSDRIHTISGDISKEKLGLNDADYEFILNNATHIIHCAAAVNHMYGYSKLKTSNSLNTVEFIKLSMNGREKKMSYISTESAISENNADGVGYEAEVSKVPGDFFGGYALTKWVSERLLEQAFDRGMSGLILRPGNIFLNTKTGISSPITSNFALLMMRAYVDTSLAPDLGFVYEAVPVNQLAEAIVSLSLSECNKTMLNLSNQNEISLKEYISILSSITKKDIKIVPFEEWKKRVIDPLKETSPLFSLSLYFQDDLSEELMHFDTSLTQIQLQKNGVHFDDDYKKLLSDAFSKTFNKVFDIS